MQVVALITIYKRRKDFRSISSQVRKNIQREERDGLGLATAKMLMAVNGFRLLVTSICAVHISSQVSLGIYLKIAVIILPSAMKIV